MIATSRLAVFSRASWTLTVALLVALPLGCAPAADEDAKEPAKRPVEESAAGDPSAGEVDHSGDKALRRWFCCAGKEGNEVLWCENMYKTKVGGWNACSWGDNVLRDGQCYQYASCDGVTLNPL